MFNYDSNRHYYKIYTKVNKTWDYLIEADPQKNK